MRGELINDKMTVKRSYVHATRLIAGFFIGVLPAHADSITVTEVTKPVMCSWKNAKGDSFSVNCSYLAAIYIKAKRGCPECAWKSQRL